ncbi:unnamed protein product [Cochlearia groenlandica]
MSIKLSLVVTFTVMLMVASSSSTVAARPLTKPSLESSSLVYRLRLDEETGNCWDSLMHLQQCSGELILFFLNGETYLGPGCCKAIRTVGEKCWTTLTSVIGITAQEGDMLQGYCDDHDSENNGEDIALASSPLSMSIKFKPTTTTTVVKSSSNP